MEEIENKSSDSSDMSDVPKPLICDVVETHPRLLVVPKTKHGSVSSTVNVSNSTVSSPLPSITWPSSSWNDRNHKSAFQPYRPGLFNSVLTNLQRGNTEAEPPKQESSEFTWHQKAGRGDISSRDIPSDCKIDMFDPHGLTALMWASWYGQYPSVQLLLKEGASVNMTGLKGETPLLLAASEGHLDVLRILISGGAEVNYTDKEGNTALIFAAHNNHPQCVRELLFSGADLTVKNKKGVSAYNTAVRRKYQLVVGVIQKYLLSLLDNVEPENS